MSGLTSRLSLYKPASGENVNVTTDINNNWDSLDLNANFRSCTSSTRPSTKWDGLSIHETDTNRQYIWNSSPATSGWFEIYGAGGSINQINLSAATTATNTLTSNTTGDTNKRLQVRGDGRLEWGSGTATPDAFLRRTGVNALTTDGSLTVATTTTVQSTTDSTALSVSGGGTFSKSLTVAGSASLGGGQGVFNLRNATTAPTASSTDGVIVYSESNQLKQRTASGSIQFVGGTLGLSSTTTVASTAAETNIVSVTIPANDAVAGATYRLKAWGHASTTGTPSLYFKALLGANQMGVTGTAGTAGFTTATVSLHSWTAEIDVVCLASNSWFGNLTVVENISVSGTAPVSSAAVRSDGGGTVGNLTSSSNALILAVKWGTSSASNTLTCRGYTVERLS